MLCMQKHRALDGVVRGESSLQTILGMDLDDFDVDDISGYSDGEEAVLQAK
jgi:hypothetical protein